MKKYTLGFVFDTALSTVALMEKARPEWQKGKLNGIGGKIEEGETSVACMVREAKEEADLTTKESEWVLVALVKAPDWIMDVYACAKEPSSVRTMTDEPISWYEIARLPDTVLSNVTWLMNLAADKLKNDEFVECVVTYV